MLFGTNQNRLRPLVPLPATHEAVAQVAHRLHQHRRYVLFEAPMGEDRERMIDVVDDALATLLTLQRMLLEHDRALTNQKA